MPNLYGRRYHITSRNSKRINELPLIFAELKPIIGKPSRYLVGFSYVFSQACCRSQKIDPVFSPSIHPSAFRWKRYRCCVP